MLNGHAKPMAIVIFVNFVIFGITFTHNICKSAVKRATQTKSRIDSAQIICTHSRKKE